MHATARPLVHRTDHVEARVSEDGLQRYWYSETVITVNASSNADALYASFPEQKSGITPPATILPLLGTLLLLVYNAVFVRIMINTRYTSLKQPDGITLALAWPVLLLASDKYRAEMRAALIGRPRASDDVPRS